MFRIWYLRDKGYSGCGTISGVGCLGCLGYGTFGVWDVWNMECLGCRIFRVLTVWNVECLIYGRWLGCEIFRMWDLVGCWFTKLIYLWLFFCNITFIYRLKFDKNGFIRWRENFWKCSKKLENKIFYKNVDINLI